MVSFKPVTVQFVKVAFFEAKFLCGKIYFYFSQFSTLTSENGIETGSGWKDGG
jgi:hypothetical protein